MKRIRFYYILTLRFILSRIKFNMLNASEAEGHFSFFTRLKFAKKNIIQVPYERGLTIRGVGFNTAREKSKDGFMRALKVKRGDIDKEVFQTVLSSVFSNEKKLTISDFSNGIENPSLRVKPIHTFAYPWESKTIDQKELSYESDLMKNRSSYADELSDDVYHLSHLDSHLTQFSSLYQSIAKSGLIFSNTPPKVYILVKGKSWKWIMSGDGNHRAYCNHLTGAQHINVSVQGVIDRERLFKISQSNKHIYSSNEVRNLFDILWTGDHCVRGIL